MPIDPTHEELVTLAQATKCRVWPSRRRGKRPHVATLHRWASVGCSGVRLETVSVGATRCTSSEAIVRFLEAVTRARSGAGVPAPESRRAATSRARSVEHELDSLGIC